MKNPHLVSMPPKGKITVREDLDEGGFWLEIDNGEEAIEQKLTQSSLDMLGRLFINIARKKLKSS